MNAHCEWGFCECNAGTVRKQCPPPDELEASPAGSRSDDYALAFFGFQRPHRPISNYFGLLLLQQLAWAA